MPAKKPRLWVSRDDDEDWYVLWTSEPRFDGGLFLARHALSMVASLCEKLWLANGGPKLKPGECCEVEIDVRRVVVKPKAKKRKAVKRA